MADARLDHAFSISKAIGAASSTPLPDDLPVTLMSLHRALEGPRANALAARTRALAAPLSVGKQHEDDWYVADLPQGHHQRRIRVLVPAHPVELAAAFDAGVSAVVIDLDQATAPDERSIALAYDTLVRLPAQLRSRSKDSPWLAVRPRALVRDEPMMRVDGEVIGAAVVDLAVAIMSLATAESVRAPLTIDIPDLTGAEDAAWWDTALTHMEGVAGLSPGAVRVNVSIDTLTGLLNLDAILSVLRQRVVSASVDRWQLAASLARHLSGEHPLPDRRFLTPGTGFLRAAGLLSIRLAHRRGAEAFGPISDWIPDASTPHDNTEALEKVRADKERAAMDGHDGTSVAHPFLAQTAREVFDRMVPETDQRDRRREDASTDLAALMHVPVGECTAAGLSRLCRIALSGLAAWRSGFGRIPLDGRLVDGSSRAAACAHLRHWLNSSVPIENSPLGRDRLRAAIDDAAAQLALERSDIAAALPDASAALITSSCGANEFTSLEVDGWARS